MKKLVLLALAVLLLHSTSLATWEDANGRGIAPYWQSVEDWFTMIVFVNGSEGDYETIYVHFCDVHGNCSSDTHADSFGIRPGEQLTVSTKPGVGYSMVVSAFFGYVQFRADEGGHIHAYTLIYNQLTGGGFVVPTYSQDSGF
ncbi:MAG: hypothetical protein JW759_00065 [Candidatus Coatesbacteria bacterium]|nr:hypothetical protein [Candidatus Coatesbacteria bacterium]